MDQPYYQIQALNLIPPSKRHRSEISDENESEKHLETKFRKCLDTLSICYMFDEECKNNPDRFIDGKCRIAAQEEYKQLYRVSARQHIKSMLVRGMRLNVISRMPFDKNAEETLANIPR